MPRGQYDRSQMRKPIVSDDKTEAVSGFFPVKVLRNYRPIGDYRIITEDEITKERTYHEPPELNADQDEGIELQLRAGQMGGVPVDEAKRMISLGIAERADEIAIH